MNAAIDNSAIQAMTVVLLEEILLKTDQPNEFPAFAAQEFLELTGARTAVMVECLQLENSCSHRVIATVPSRRAVLAEQKAIYELIDLLHDHNETQVWNPEESGPHVKPLGELGVGLSIAVPFSAGSWRAGGLLLFDLPEIERIKHVLQVFEAIAQVVALSLRSALLFESQGAILNARSKSLQQHRKSLQAFFDNKLIGMVQLDREGNYKQVNQQWEQMTGYCQDELLKMNNKDLTHPDDLNKNTLIEQFEQSPHYHALQSTKRYIRKDGTIFWANVSGTGLYSDEDQFMGLVGIINDISVQKEHEKALRDSEKHLRTVFEAADNVAFVTTDIAGEETLITSFSRGAERTFGYSAEEVIGQRVAVLHPLGVEKKFSAMQLALGEGNKGYSGEALMVRKSGELFPALFTIHPLHSDSGELIGTVGITVDITERKQAEADRLELETQLRQKYKMEAVGVMAGGMAHNFNNNLSIILGNVELSQMKVQNPEIQGLLGNAKIAILRSRDLVSQIMTYSRKGDPTKAALQLPLILDETIKLLRSTMPTTVQLNQNISEACTHISINADASQIQECLLNLCNNAVQAMDEQGTLDISLDLVVLEKHDLPELGNHQPGSYIKLSLQDSGCGIAPEILEKIFDPFFTTKELYEGTGMGLATVQGIIDQHDGIIQVRSTLGEGTTFDLYFPTIEQAQATEPTALEEELIRGSEKILFIDDDEMLAKLGDLMLTEMGYQVSMMTDSSDALKLFTAHPEHFDLVITDQTMPELTGKELIQKLKAIRADIPTIICTGFSSKLDEDSARELGASAFLMKPLDLPELLQTIRRVLDGE